MFVVVVKGGYVCVLLGFYFCLYLANVGLVGVKQRWVRLRFLLLSHVRFYLANDALVVLKQRWVRFRFLLLISISALCSNKKCLCVKRFVCIFSCRRVKVGAFAFSIASLCLLVPCKCCSSCPTAKVGTALMNNVFFLPFV